MSSFNGVPHNFRFDKEEKPRSLFMPIRIVRIFGQDEMGNAIKLNNEYVTEECDEQRKRNK